MKTPTPNLNQTLQKVGTGMAAVGGLYIWTTQTFGAAIWLLLGVLLVRYILFLTGEEKKNPFVSLIIYIGSLMAAQLSGGAGVMDQRTMKAVVILAAIYEAKAVLADLPALIAALQPKAPAADVQVEVAQLREAVTALTAMLLKAAPADVTPPAGVEVAPDGGRSGP